MFWGNCRIITNISTAYSISIFQAFKHHPFTATTSTSLHIKPFRQNKASTAPHALVSSLYLNSPSVHFPQLMGHHTRSGSMTAAVRFLQTKRRQSIKSIKSRFINVQEWKDRKLKKPRGRTNKLKTKRKKKSWAVEPLGSKTTRQSEASTLQKCLYRLSERVNLSRSTRNFRFLLFKRPTCHSSLIGLAFEKSNKTKKWSDN